MPVGKRLGSPPMINSKALPPIQHPDNTSTAVAVASNQSELLLENSRGVGFVFSLTITSLYLNVLRVFSLPTSELKNAYLYNIF